jgi:tRNA-splicing ligase RtcB
MSSRQLPAHVRAWTVEPLSPAVITALERLATHPDVAHVAVMPDVHLAEDVCIGTVVATRSVLFPAAVGGDIGCGMAALAFDCEAELLSDPRSAAALLEALGEAVPTLRHSGASGRALPAELVSIPLSCDALERVRAREGPAELGTLGRGNHFVELQTDSAGQLWLMVHTGSRALGQAIRDHHLQTGARQEGRLVALDAASERGQAYLCDLTWALAFADANRAALVEAVARTLQQLFDVHADWSSLILCQHNHVRRETHFGEELWVHRKGAISARPGELGIIPGSMGTSSVHTSGLGCPEALMSSSHGAGRTMSRTEAQRQISTRRLQRELGGVWYDHRLATRLRDEAPSAYKDLRRVMRAQSELTATVRALRPVLSFKGA